MIHPLRLALAALVVATAASTPALAQKGGEPLESTLVARKVVVAEGRESLVDAADARPGDVIEYVATYRNTGKDAIRGLKAALPIPPQTEYIPGSARPAKAQASLDGKAFADMPLRRKTTRNGQAIDEPVPWREYRAIRWDAGDLAAGDTLPFTIRVRVIDERN